MSDALPSGACSQDRPCYLFRELFGEKKLSEKAQRQVSCAILHARHHDGYSLVLTQEPGISGRPKVHYAGMAPISEVSVGTTLTLPSQQREGRSSGRGPRQ